MDVRLGGGECGNDDTNVSGVSGITCGLSGAAGVCLSGVLGAIGAGAAHAEDAGWPSSSDDMHLNRASSSIKLYSSSYEAPSGSWDIGSMYVSGKLAGAGFWTDAAGALEGADETDAGKDFDTTGDDGLWRFFVTGFAGENFREEVCLRFFLDFVLGAFIARPGFGKKIFP